MTAIETRNRILLYASIALLPSPTVLVQEGFGQSTPSVAPYNQPTLPDQGAAGPVHNFPHSFADQAFVKLMMERDASETQLGQLAQQRSQSDDIKQLAQKLVGNRTALDKQLKLMAHSLEVTVPNAPTKKDNQLIARLAALSGSQFDEEYLKAVAKSYRQNIKDFQIEAQNAQDPYLLYEVQQDVPAIAKYLQAIEDVARVHNVTIDAKK
jgi:putative membrane protein